jgi:hypothetical protein
MIPLKLWLFETYYLKFETVTALHLFNGHPSASCNALPVDSSAALAFSNNQ